MDQGKFKVHIPQHGIELIDRPQDIFEILDRHGVFLIRNQSIDIAYFTKITNTIGRDFMAYLGMTTSRSAAIDDAGTIFPVTNPEHVYAIPLHGEIYYMPHHPKLLFFYCQTPAGKGGKTTLCDATTLWKVLPDEARQRFGSTPIRYIRYQGPDTWRQLYRTESLETVRQICMTNGVEFDYCSKSDTVITRHTCSAVVETCRGPAFINNFLPFAEREMASPVPIASVVRFADDEQHPIPDELVWTVRRVAESLTVAHTWQYGDVMVIDNQTILHGRTLIEDPNRRVLLRMAGSRRQRS